MNYAIITTYTYDASGNIAEITDCNGNKTTYTYDNYGRAKSITDAVGVCTEYEYDIAGSVTKNLLTGEEYVYNVYGEVTKYIDGEGNVTTYTYDGQGNVTEVTDALGNVTGYTYRKDGLLKAIRDANGAVTEYTYNEKGLVESETDALGAVTTYQYDKEDRVTSVTRPDGTVTGYTYNSDSNVTKIEAVKADGTTSVLRYLYALDGSLTASISDTDILIYAYDAKGQLTELQKNGTHRLGFGYDSNGNLLWLKESADGNPYRADNVTGYEYDAAGRLTSVYADGKSSYEFVENHHTGSKDAREYYTGGTLLAQYTYNADGTQNTITDGAGNITSYTYTAYKQVAELETVSANGSLLYREKNTYDANGSLLERVTSGSTVVTEQTGTSVYAEYAYDALDRLLSEKVDGIITSYTYDTMGNRVSKTEDGVVTTYIYDLCNKLLSEVTKVTETKDEVVTTYLYDGIGNLLEKITEDGSTTYTYDALHQLTKTVNQDGTWQESTYDASGIRSMLSENGVTTEYMSYNGLALTGYDKTGGQTEHYCYGTSLLAAELCVNTEENKNSTNLYYYIKNSHEDVIGLSDNDGTLTETYTYDAFGTLTSIQALNKNGVLEVTETAVSRFLYAGEQYDSITELYYLRARRYDTTAGRFIQEDTYLGDGRNLYVYVGNNPLKYVDPSGYCTKTSKINLYTVLFENPWEPDFSFSGERGKIETTIENLLYIQKEIVIAKNSFNFGTMDAIADNLTMGIFELDDTPKGKDIFYAAGKVRGEIMVMAAELYGAVAVGSNSSSGSNQSSVVAVSSYGKEYATDMSSGMAIGSEGVFLAAASYSAKRVGDAASDLVEKIVDDILRIKYKANAPKTINYDSKQVGKKWGEHMKDYPNMDSYMDYKRYANEVFNSPDQIIFDSFENEYYYIKGEDLLRVKENGDFISLYPGGESERVIRAIRNGGAIWP